MKTNTVILTFSMLIIVFYALGGLGFMIVTKLPYQPDIGASITMTMAMVAASVTWVRTATT